MSGKYHIASIACVKDYFKHKGFKVLENNHLNLSGRGCVPDLLIVIDDDILIPFECGNIQQDLPGLYLKEFYGYYHADRIGRLILVTQDGKTSIDKIRVFLKKKILHRRPKRPSKIRRERVSPSCRRRRIRVYLGPSCAACGKHLATDKLISWGGVLRCRGCFDSFIIKPDTPLPDI